MNEDLHDIDRIFYTHLEEYQEKPSADMWNRLNAGLDKKDAVIYKRKFLHLYRVAALLLFLLVSLSLYEVGFIIQRNSTAALPNKGIVVPGKQSKGNNVVNENPVERNAHRGKDILYTINMPIQKQNELHKNIKNSGDPANELSHFKKEKRLPFINNPRPAETTKNYPQYSSPADSVRTDFAAGLTAGKQSLLPAIDSSLLSTTYNKIPNNKINKPFQPYWTISVSANREWAQYHLEDNPQTENNSNLYGDNRTSILKREKQEPSYTFGLFGTYQIQKKLLLQTGLSYSYTAITIEPQKVYAVKDYRGGVSYKYNTSSGFAFLKTASGTSPAPGDSVYTTTAEHNLGYISIPLLAAYKITGKRISLSAGGGFAIDILSKAKIKTEIQNTSVNETVSVNRLQGMRSFYTEAIARADIQYTVKGAWSLSITPSFRYALASINKDNIVKTYPYSFGLGIACAYKF